MHLRWLLAASLSLISCGQIESYRTLDQSYNQKLSAPVGGVVLKIRKTRDLPNAWGKADIWGGKVNEGYTEIRYLGVMSDGTLLLRLLDLDVQSNEDVFTRYMNRGIASRESLPPTVTEIRHNYKQNPQLSIFNTTLKIFDATPTNLSYMVLKHSSDQYAAPGNQRIIETDSVNARELDNDKRPLAYESASDERAQQAATKITKPSVPPSDVDRVTLAQPPVKKNAYAVVIGIEDYQQKLPKADYAAHDAEIMGQYLTKALGYQEENVVVMLDSCFSGAGGRSVIAKGMRPMVLSVENPLLTKGRTMVLTAGASDQVSSTYDQKSHGLLTYFFLKGLQGEADQNNDKRIELREVFEYLKPQVERTARREFHNEQTPQLTGSPDTLSKGVVLIEGNK